MVPGLIPPPGLVEKRRFFIEISSGGNGASTDGAAAVGGGGFVFRRSGAGGNHGLEDLRINSGNGALDISEAPLAAEEAVGARFGRSAAITLRAQEIECRHYSRGVKLFRSISTKPHICSKYL
ncbi:unnamed protein product [Linum trigynum]